MLQSSFRGAKGGEDRFAPLLTGSSPSLLPWALCLRPAMCAFPLSPFNYTFWIIKVFECLKKWRTKSSDSSLHPNRHRYNNSIVNQLDSVVSSSLLLKTQSMRVCSCLEPPLVFVTFQPILPISNPTSSWLLSAASVCSKLTFPQPFAFNQTPSSSMGQYCLPPW